MSGAREGNPSPQAPAPKQSCCLGLLYLSQHVKQQGSGPTCIGLRQKQDGSVKLPQLPEHLGNDPQNYQFMCLGYSIYEDGKPVANRDASTSGRQTVPYCEGVEIIRLEVPQDSKADAHAQQSAESPSTATPGTSSRTAQQRREASTSPGQAGSTPSTSGTDLQDFTDRYWRSMQRNLHRMKLTWDHMYSATLKPVVDRVLGGKDDEHT